MVTSGYRYVVIVIRADGKAAGQAAIEVDWESAEEWARFVALRRGRATSRTGLPTIAEPIWHPTLRAPFAAGVRLTAGAAGAQGVASDLDTAYFQNHAQAAIAQLIEKGRLTTRDRVGFVIAAFARGEVLDSTAPSVFVSEDASPVLECPSASRDEIEHDAVVVGEADADDVRVFVPQRVLEEASALAGEAGANETGGVLIGHVHRDERDGDLFVRVTAQLPARHTESSATRLTFTAATWTDVRGALALRGRGEIMLGWWHSHPVRDWCRECPIERQRACALAHGFFSEHDRALHRAVFSAAYSVGLVINEGIDTPTFSMFGWRQGLIEERAFGVTDATRPASAFQGTVRPMEGESCSQREPATTSLVS